MQCRTCLVCVRPFRAGSDGADDRAGPGTGNCDLTVGVLTVARIDAAFPRATAMETRWANQAVSLLSPVRAVSRRPRSFTSPAAAGPKAPEVSTAKGTKIYLSQRAAYFARFRSSAVLAALPGFRADWSTAVAENVSEQVASQTRLMPLLKGNSVMPSGRRPSPLSRPAGSNTLSSPVLLSARCNTSLRFA